MEHCESESAIIGVRTNFYEGDASWLSINRPVYKYHERTIKENCYDDVVIILYKKNNK